MREVICTRGTDELVIVPNELVDGRCASNPGGTAIVHLQLATHFDCARGLDGVG